MAYGTPCFEWTTFAEPATASTAFERYRMPCSCEGTLKHEVSCNLTQLPFPKCALHWLRPEKGTQSQQNRSKKYHKSQTGCQQYFEQRIEVKTFMGKAFAFQKSLVGAFMGKVFFYELKST
eukprot:3045641-Amphidinium_carterae.1